MINWQTLAETCGTITYVKDGHHEQGGSKVAADALIEIIGESALVDGVDHYIAGKPGAELARSILSALRPPAAMARCHEIFMTSGDEQAKSLAIHLLQAVADQRVMPWIHDHLACDNVGVRLWAVGIVDQLVTVNAEIEPEEALPLIHTALNDMDERVRERASQLLEMIKSAGRENTLQK